MNRYELVKHFKKLKSRSDEQNRLVAMHGNPSDPNENRSHYNTTVDDLTSKLLRESGVIGETQADKHLQQLAKRSMSEETYKQLATKLYAN